MIINIGAVEEGNNLLVINATVMRMMIVDAMFIQIATSISLKGKWKKHETTLISMGFPGGAWIFSGNFACRYCFPS